MVEQIDKTNISVVDFISGLIDYLSGKTADKMVLKDVGGGGKSGYELVRAEMCKMWPIAQ